MKETKICGICKEKFERVYANHKYCSPECVRKSECNLSKKWRDKNPEKVKEMSKAYYHKDPLKCKKMWQNWIKANREKVNLTRKRYYHRNKEIDLIRKRDNKLIKKEYCVECKHKKNLEVHHRSYFPSITMVLCEKCHLKKHGKVKRDDTD